MILRIPEDQIYQIKKNLQAELRDTYIFSNNIYLNS